MEYGSEFYKFSPNTLLGRNRDISFLSDTYSDRGVPLYICYLSYSDQLEDYISRYKRRPQDIKYWPYGPYWPSQFEGLLLNTPRHLWKDTPGQEPLATGEYGRHLLGT